MPEPEPISPVVTLTTFGGNGLRREVDLDDTAALYDLMGADEA